MIIYFHGFNNSYRNILIGVLHWVGLLCCATIFIFVVNSTHLTWAFKLGSLIWQLSTILVDNINNNNKTVHIIIIKILIIWLSNLGSSVYCSVCILGSDCLCYCQTIKSRRMKPSSKLKYNNIYVSILCMIIVWTFQSNQITLLWVW